MPAVRLPVVALRVSVAVAVVPLKIGLKKMEEFEF